MRVIVAGGTGFIGSELTRRLVGAGHEVALPSRDPERSVRRLYGGGKVPPGVSFEAWDGQDPARLAAIMENARAVVNLVGENIAARRWSAEQKQRIVESRVNAGKAVVQALGRVTGKPEVLVQASATGYYGDRGDEVLREDAPPGAGFLAETCKAWEASTQEAEAMGVRRVVIRTSVVLDRGGALAKMLPPYRFFLGGPMGGGRQWFSWIHRRDEAGAILWLLENTAASGPYNLAAPHPLTNKEFCRVLGKSLGRPCWLPAPGFALKLALGDMARELLLFGQRVVPDRLEREGFSFEYPEAGRALAAILG